MAVCLIFAGFDSTLFLPQLPFLQLLFFQLPDGVSTEDLVSVPPCKLRLVKELITVLVQGFVSEWHLLKCSNDLTLWASVDRDIIDV